MQAYSDPKRASDPHALPDVEVWHVPQGIPYNECPGCIAANEDFSGPVEHWPHVDYAAHCAEHVGWYWQACLPGCLPDGDPVGPFKTEAEALADAQRDAEE